MRSPRSLGGTRHRQRGLADRNHKRGARSIQRNFLSPAWRVAIEMQRPTNDRLHLDGGECAMKNISGNCA
ncbi:MAG: hypothetical protein IPJ07_21395 [Acidobacteria bacterium]|nr:hypothetical protein [Acidobacteriota bacterium]